MGNKSNVNRKLRAKQGKIRWRIFHKSLHPQRTESLMSKATRERVRLEQIREAIRLRSDSDAYYPNIQSNPNIKKRRLEEPEAIDLHGDLPSVELIAERMRRGAWDGLGADIWA